MKPSIVGAGAGAVLLLVLTASCAHLPALAPIPGTTRAAVASQCKRAFPTQPWRATHTIVATLPFGANGALLGVTAVSPEGLRAILLSPEGIRLFEGLQKHAGSGGLTILRAVSPFDRSDFAPSLMADVGHAFLQPAGEPSEIGKDVAGATVCRWTLPSHEATEVVLGASGPSQIRTFRNLRLTRQIELLDSPKDGFFPHVRLTVPGAGGYTLDMQLVDHE